MEPLPAADVERRLRLTAELATDHAFMLVDAEGRVRWWSPGAAIIFDYTAEQILGKPASILFAPEDKEAGMPSYEMQVARLDGPAEDDRWMLRRDGSRFWANGIMVALLDDDGKTIGFGKILRNRTDVKEQLETLRNAAREAEAAVRRKDIFLGMLSHELRNPLGPIANALALIRSGVPDMSHEVAYAVNAIGRQMQMLERLVQDLLEHTRITTGKVELRLEPVVLQELLSEVISDLQSKAEARRQRLEFVAPEGPILVQVDRDRLHQVAANLVVNAIKYTPVDGRIWVKASTEGEDAVFKVADNGVGIPNEMQPRIFELFTQVESSRRESQGGLGLGLALVKNLVSLHGGSVQVRSDGLGKGSEFTVRLPLAALNPA